jgi:HD-like signal output (HDOD) protein
LSEPVASLDEAVFMLGYRRICQTAITLAMRGPLSIPLQGYTLEANDLWCHSLLAATAAEHVIEDGMNFGVDSSTAFTVGLLHDLGKLVVNEFITRESFIAIRRHLLEGRSRVEAERAVMGTDHAEVGAGLLYVWRLPEQPDNEALIFASLGFDDGKLNSLLTRILEPAAANQFMVTG